MKENEEQIKVNFDIFTDKGLEIANVNVRFEFPIDIKLQNSLVEKISSTISAWNEEVSEYIEENKASKQSALDKAKAVIDRMYAEREIDRETYEKMLEPIKLRMHERKV